MAATNVTLHEFAKEFGIPNHETMDRDTLIKAIKGQMSTRWLSVTAIFISVIAAMASVGQLIVGIVSTNAAIQSATAATHSANTAMENLNLTLKETERSEVERQKEERQTKVLAWQKIIVFKIIEKGYYESKQKGGWNFDVIKGKYVTEAATVQGIDLKKEELSDLALKRIILDLMANQLIFQTVDEHFIINAALMNPRFDRTYSIEEVKYEIMNLITTEGGKYTVEAVGQKIHQKLAGTKPEEYNYVINNLIATRMLEITTEKDQKVLWTAASRPGHYEAINELRQLITKQQQAIDEQERFLKDLRRKELEKAPQKGGK